MLFTGHKWASDALLGHMDATLYYEGSRDQAEGDPRFRAELESLAAERRLGRGPRKQRVVYLRQRGG